MPTTITMIGAGSIGFTRTLVHDLLSVPELQDAQIVLTDIDKRALDRVYRLLARDIEANGLPARLWATPDRRDALTGANYVFSMVRVGGLEAYAHDIEIPLRYGVDQCVGDTLGPGGIMYGQRGIPVMLEFCKDIREVAAENCVFMNYSNPMAMLTWACNVHGGVPTIGLCHGVQGSSSQIAQALGVPLEELDITAAGINHQTWFISVKHRGQERVGELLEAFEKHPTFMKTEKVRIDMLRRFGHYSTESNGHLSEYVPWYRKRPREIRKWADLSVWINGETGGYLRYCRERNEEFDREFDAWLAQPATRLDERERSFEHGSRIIEAMETGRVYRGHFNVMNNGLVENLPDDCVVEVPGYVDGSGLNPVRAGRLPLACAATCQRSIDVQRMSVEAAVHGDATLLKQAMLHDPLTGAVCNPPEVWQMVDEMLVAQSRWLPQYQTAVAAAAQRLENEPRVPTKAWEGGARLKRRTTGNGTSRKGKRSKSAPARPEE
jgi:alpha-galactosidase